MRVILFSLLLIGCISKRSDFNYNRIQTYSIFNGKATQDSNYYQFDKKGRITKVVTFHDLGKMKSVVEFSKRGRLISEKIYQSDTIFYEVIYYGDKRNSVKKTFSYSHGQKTGLSFGHFKLDSNNQTTPILYSYFNYQNNLLNGEGYFYYKNGQVREKHVYQNGKTMTIFYYNENGRFRTCSMTDSIARLWGYKCKTQ